MEAVLKTRTELFNIDIALKLKTAGKDGDEECDLARRRPQLE